MVKTIYKAPGQISITYAVTTIRNGRKYTTEETGTNSTNNVYGSLKDDNFKRNIALNAIAKHYSRYNDIRDTQAGSPTLRELLSNNKPITEIMSYDIRYFDDISQTKIKNTKRGKYAYTYNKEGKVIGRVKPKPYKPDEYSTV